MKINASSIYRWASETLRRGFSTLRRGYRTLRRGFSTIRRGFSTLRRGFQTFRRGFSTLIRSFLAVIQGLTNLTRRRESYLTRWQKLSRSALPALQLRETYSPVASPARTYTAKSSGSSRDLLLLQSALNASTTSEMTSFSDSSCFLNHSLVSE